MMNLQPDEMAIRAHDITVVLERTSVPEFNSLTLLGLATRLSLHLRGVQAVPYHLVRDAAIYLLDFPNSLVVSEVLRLLEDVEFVKLVTEGHNIKTVIPDIPYYDSLFENLGEYTSTNHKFSEPEALTLALVHRLSESPIVIDQAYNIGAEKGLVDRIITIGNQGSFIRKKRARGRSILISPTYFPEKQGAYADLVAAAGSHRVQKILNLLKNYQGWPLSKIVTEKEIFGTSLDDQDIKAIKMLAGDGFIAPPAIETSHAGLNYFLFGPRPDDIRIAPTKRPIYEAAMALVASVRQGQLLPNQYAIRSPQLLLSAFRDRGYINANTEALEQYRQVAALRVGRLEQTNSGWAKFVLIDRPENIEAVNMAIQLVSGEEYGLSPSEDIVLALKQGDKYLESLIGTKRTAIENKVIEPDEDTKMSIEAFFLRGV